MLRVEIEELEKIRCYLKERRRGVRYDWGPCALKIGTVPEKGEVIAITEEVTVEILRFYSKSYQTTKSYM